MQAISSIKDRRIVLARAAGTRRGRGASGKMLLEGEQVLGWALEHRLQVEYLLVAGSPPTTLAGKSISQNIPAFLVSGGIQKKVTGRSYVVPLVGVANIPPERDETHDSFVVVLDGVKDYGNIGTIIRTCQAFGVREIVATPPDIDIYQPKTIEASRGSVFSISIQKYANSAEALNCLRESGYQIVATSPRGNRLQSLLELKPGPVALVVGNESQGVSREVEAQADYLIQIPMSQAVESLNVGVATGISLYELKLKQVMAMVEQQIKSTLGRELNVAGMLVQRALDEELHKVSGLSSRQVVFMMVLKCDREMLVGDMCRQFGVLDAEVGAFLDPLTRDALIIQDEKLRLTPKGEEVLAKLWFTVESAESKILSGFSHEEVRLLKDQLRRIQHNCTQIAGLS